MEPTKPIWTSKTIWLNALLTLAAVIQGLMGADWIHDNPGLTSLLVTVVGVLNVILRYVTATAVNLTGETKR